MFQVLPAVASFAQTYYVHLLMSRDYREAFKVRSLYENIYTLNKMITKFDSCSMGAVSNNEFQKCGLFGYFTCISDKISTTSSTFRHSHLEHSINHIQILCFTFTLTGVRVGKTDSVHSKKKLQINKIFIFLGVIFCSIHIMKRIEQFCQLHIN